MKFCRRLMIAALLLFPATALAESVDWGLGHPSDENFTCNQVKRETFYWAGALATSFYQKDRSWHEWDKEKYKTKNPDPEKIENWSYLHDLASKNTRDNRSAVAEWVIIYQALCKD